jgi:hypothetical protein
MNDISDQMREYEKKCREHAAQGEKLKGELRVIQSLCTHPNMRKAGYYDGSTAMFCPDCKKET